MLMRIQDAEARPGGGVMPEMLMLIQDADDLEMAKDWQKEKMCNKINKAESEVELDKDRDTVCDAVDLNSQETVKVQIHGRASGDKLIIRL